MRIVLGIAVMACAGCDNGVLDAFEPVTSTGPSGLLDDFEDRDTRAGEDGWWYPQDDGTGPEALITFEAVADRGQSLYALRLDGGPTEGFGAFVGVALPGGLFDAGAFASLSFAVRADPPLMLGVAFLDSIFDHYDSTVAVTTEWQTISLPLSGFVLGDSALDRSQLTHLQFWVHGPSGSFDLWIDDVWLLPPS